MEQTPLATVLVVDDDPDVLELAVSVIETEGHFVLSATSGREALKLLQGPTRVDLLFTDVVMPEMNGFALAQRAREIRPKLRVLYTSGHLKNIPAGELGRAQGRLVAKPWRAKELAAEIRNALG
jgi:CheY-like chemotaxis protein